MLDPITWTIISKNKYVADGFMFVTVTFCLLALAIGWLGLNMEQKACKPLCSSSLGESMVRVQLPPFPPAPIPITPTVELEGWGGVIMIHLSGRLKMLIRKIEEPNKPPKKITNSPEIPRKPKISSGQNNFVCPVLWGVSGLNLQRQTHSGEIYCPPLEWVTPLMPVSPGWEELTSWGLLIL